MPVVEQQGLVAVQQAHGARFEWVARGASLAAVEPAVVEHDIGLAPERAAAQYVVPDDRADLLASAPKPRRDRDFASQRARNVAALAVEFADAAQQDSGLATRAAGRRLRWVQTGQREPPAS